MAPGITGAEVRVKSASLPVRFSLTGRDAWATRWRGAVPLSSRFSPAPRTGIAYWMRAFLKKIAVYSRWVGSQRLTLSTRKINEPLCALPSRGAEVGVIRAAAFRPQRQSAAPPPRPASTQGASLIVSANSPQGGWAKASREGLSASTRRRGVAEIGRVKR